MKILVALLTMAVSASTGAQINKCFDASGKLVGYASQCPEGTRSEQTAIRNAPAAPASAKASSLAERDAEFRKRQIERQEAEAKAQTKAAQTEQRQRACDDAQAYLKSLQGGQRIARTDPKTGERSFLTDAEYPKEIANAQRAVGGNCK